MPSHLWKTTLDLYKERKRGGRERERDPPHRRPLVLCDCVTRMSKNINKAKKKSPAVRPVPIMAAVSRTSRRSFPKSPSRPQPWLQPLPGSAGASRQPIHVPHAPPAGRAAHCPPGCPSSRSTTLAPAPSHGLTRPATSSSPERYSTGQMPRTAALHKGEWRAELHTKSSRQLGSKHMPQAWLQSTHMGILTHRGRTRGPSHPSPASAPQRCSACRIPR